VSKTYFDVSGTFFDGPIHAGPDGFGRLATVIVALERSLEPPRTRNLPITLLTGKNICILQY